MRAFRLVGGTNGEAQMDESENRGSKLAELRRARMERSPPVLRGGFRPFFLGAAAWAPIALGLWLLVLSGSLALPTAMDPLAWHRHEMLFGFVGAVATGFLLTAIPNWTGRLPIAGVPLLSLWTVWLLARVAMLASGATGSLVAAVVDVGFFVLVAGLAAREVLAAHNRNLPVVILILLLGLACAVDHAAMAGLLADRGIGMRGAIAIVVVMISLIGGRIVPSFTRNWMTKRALMIRMPEQPGRFDLAVIAITGAAMLGWVIAPQRTIVGYGLFAAGLLQLLRLARWSGHRTAGDPLVLVLHLGYLWVPIGLLLLGSSAIGTSMPPSAAIHALTAGAMGTMILAVMTRATLGHTGRALTAGGATTVIYLLVTLGAVLRVFGPLTTMDYLMLMRAAGLAWGGAFLLFLLVYGPMLVGSKSEA